MRVAFSFAAILAAIRLGGRRAAVDHRAAMGEGWEIAGYTSGYDNRSTLLLFRHKDKNYLIQCSTSTM